MQLSEGAVLKTHTSTLKVKEQGKDGYTRLTEMKDPSANWMINGLCEIKKSREYVGWWEISDGVNTPPLPPAPEKESVYNADVGDYIERQDIYDSGEIETVKILAKCDSCVLISAHNNYEVSMRWFTLQELHNAGWNLKD